MKSRPRRRVGTISSTRAPARTTRPSLAKRRAAWSREPVNVVWSARRICEVAGSATTPRTTLIPCQGASAPAVSRQGRSRNASCFTALGRWLLITPAVTFRPAPQPASPRTDTNTTTKRSTTHSVALGLQHRSHRVTSLHPPGDSAVDASGQPGLARTGVEQQRRSAQRSNRRRRSGRALAQAAGPRRPANAASRTRNTKRESLIAAPD
jgi:hypothetical protein